MMGERTVMQEALFYSFRIEDHVPADHLLRSIDRFVDLTGIREHLKPFYSDMGRPSVNPELMIRMLIIGYCMGIRSERHLWAQRALQPKARSAQDHALGLRRRTRHGARYRHHRRLSRLPPPAEEGRDAVRSPETHPEAGSLASARSQRSERRVPPRRSSPEPAQTGKDEADPGPRTRLRGAAPPLVRYPQRNSTRASCDFFNRIGWKAQFRFPIRYASPGSAAFHPKSSQRSYLVNSQQQ